MVEKSLAATLQAKRLQTNWNAPFTFYMASHNILNKSIYLKSCLSNFSAWMEINASLPTAAALRLSHTEGVPVKLFNWC